MAVMSLFPALGKFLQPNLATLSQLCHTTTLPSLIPFDPTRYPRVALTLGSETSYYMAPRDGVVVVEASPKDGTWQNLL